MLMLQTPCMILHDFEMDDLDEIYTLAYADPQEKVTWSGVTGAQDAIKDRFADHHILPGSRFGLKAIVLKQDHPLIGLKGFQLHERAEGEAIDYLLTKEAPQGTVNFDPDCLEAKLTIALGRAFWKHGYATEVECAS